MESGLEGERKKNENGEMEVIWELRLILRYRLRLRVAANQSHRWLSTWH
jgi:hypothetical protein